MTLTARRELSEYTYQLRVKARQDLLRRIFLLALVFVTMLVTGMIQGCAVTYQQGWEPDPYAAKCTSVKWVQVEPERIPQVCKVTAQQAVNLSCEAYCNVFSPFSEAEAHQLRDPDGMDLWTHEVVMHGLKGLRHPS